MLGITRTFFPVLVVLLLSHHVVLFAQDADLGDAGELDAESAERPYGDNRACLYEPDLVHALKHLSMFGPTGQDHSESDLTGKER